MANNTTYATQSQKKSFSVGSSSSAQTAPATATAPASATAATTSPATATVYPSGGGSPYTGYVINGKTYSDAEGKNRISDGSKVTLQDGRSYVMFNGQGYQTGSPSAASATPATTTKASTSAGGNTGRVTSVPYTTQNGQTKTGYIQNGITFADPNLTQRVPYGATVHTQGGDYYFDPVAGGVPTASTAANQYLAGMQNWLAQLQDSGKQQQNAIDTSVRQAVNRLNAQKTNINNQTEQANKQAELAYITASNPYGILAQQNHALGLANSGYAESTMAQLGSTYQEALTQNRLAQQAALREIDLAIEDARFNGDIQKAQSLAELAQNVAAYGIQQEATIYNAALNNLNLANNNMHFQENLNISQATLAAQMLSNGYLTPWVADTLGITPEQAQAYIDRSSGGKHQ